MGGGNGVSERNNGAAGMKGQELERGEIGMWRPPRSVCVAISFHQNGDLSAGRQQHFLFSRYNRFRIALTASASH